MKKALIIGIDSSLSSTGWAVLSYNKNPKLKDYGKIVTDAQEDTSENLLIRYRKIYDGILSLLGKYEGQIEVMVIEQPNTSRNMKVARKLIGLYQIIRFFIHMRYNIVVQEVNTKHAKSVITGNGNAEKQEVVDNINKLFKTKFKFSKKKEESDDDITDSIAVALTYIRDNLK